MGSAGISATGGASGMGSSGTSTTGATRYFFEATIAGTEYSLDEELAAGPHPQGFFIAGEGDSTLVGIFFIAGAPEVGSYQCDGGTSMYVNVSVEGSTGVDYVSPEGGCQVEITQSGAVYAGSLTAQVSTGGERVFSLTGSFLVPTLAAVDM